MAGGVSKTSAKAMRAAGSGKSALAGGDFKRIVPLNAGKHAYVILPGRGTLHVATGSGRFEELMGELAGSSGADRVRAELMALAEAHPGHGWESTLARLESKGVLGES